MSKSGFEEQLSQCGRLIYKNEGNSMEPLIRQGHDLIVIEPLEGRLKKYDVPLYKRESGQYVLHRIIKIKKDGYVTCGDNRYIKEYGVRDEQVIGVFTAVIKKKREISVKNKWYRLYVHLWCDFFPVRAGILWGINTVRIYSKSIMARFKKIKKS